ncbi:MAG: MBL fold metallo-hydrolase [Alphaproteobacteria bacterium]|nr:MBL fold metallo-hydrolase [Alphaproteobacteria bacterium]MDX5369537.1 MBL fold metallo-hydrolase [Alphaproteobacteria bacterium]MDX5464195.1 MBL fold metallo-hydrolase [Alphaproteobacteria bacterium]
MTFTVTFWGVRGSIACPGPRYVRYGGNTSCIEVTAGDETFILDSGTGIRELGLSLMRRDRSRATLLLTHTHWDHINGFPFFTPAYHPERSLRIMAGHLPAHLQIGKVLSEQMSKPFFPVPIGIMKAAMTFDDFTAGDRFQLGGGTRVATAALNHPDGACAYRLEHKGRSVCYVTDTEHLPGQPDQAILGLIEGADLVIYDCTYTDAEFPAKVGWGHSTWQEAVRLCQAANVRRLAIFHHDPDHDDPFMDAVAADARAMWDGAFVAREGMSVTLD